MATVNFSVPDDVKDAFNATFADQNKSAVIAALMREAVERVERQRRHREAVAAILELRGKAPQVSSKRIAAARSEVRRP